jgi:hypothetical protein
MEVTPLVWGLTVAAIVGPLAFDYFRDAAVSRGEASPMGSPRIVGRD